MAHETHEKRENWKMLSFFAGSRMEQDYVTPYTGNVAFPALVYTPEIPWRKWRKPLT